MVGARGFEPPTHCYQSSCATRLRHAPTEAGRPARERWIIPSLGSHAKMRVHYLGGMSMTAQVIDGKQLAAQVKSQIRQSIEATMARGHRRPGLAVVKVGDNPASEVYVRGKRKACEEVG